MYNVVCSKLYLVCRGQILFFKKCVSLLCLTLKVTQSLQGGGYIQFQKPHWPFDEKIFHHTHLKWHLYLEVDKHVDICPAGAFERRCGCIHAENCSVVAWGTPELGSSASWSQNLCCCHLNLNSFCSISWSRGQSSSHAGQQQSNLVNSWQANHFSLCDYDCSVWIWLQCSIHLPLKVILRIG